MDAVEYIGYLGTALIVGSLSMKSIIKLRVMNMSGAILYVIYGAFIGSLPVALLNGLTSSINAFHLFRLGRKKVHFELIEVMEIQEPLLHRFLEHYKDDIKDFFKAVEFQSSKNYLAYYILRDMKIAGVIIGELHKHQSSTSNDFEILIDYVTEEYRDLKNSNFLFNREQPWLKEKKIKSIYSSHHLNSHVAYLKQVGFKDDGTKYSLKISD